MAARGRSERSRRELKRRELLGKGLVVKAWVVFDAESREEQESRSYHEAIKQAEAQGIQVANSSPSFEYWILLHYAPGVLVDSPKDAERELRKTGRIPGYAKPVLPLDELWALYCKGLPSKAAAECRNRLSEQGECERLGRPVTYVDVLVDNLVSIASD